MSSPNAAIPPAIPPTQITENTAASTAPVSGSCTPRPRPRTNTMNPTIALRTAPIALALIQDRAMSGPGCVPPFIPIGIANPSDHDLAAVRGERRAGDQAGVVRRQEHDAARDLLGLAQPAERNERQDLLVEHVLGYGLDHLGRDIARADGVDGDARPRALLGQRLGEAELAGLGGRIIGLAELALLAVDGGDVDDAPEFA